MEFSNLRWQAEGAVATVLMDRPPVNAVDQQMYSELHALFSDVGLMGPDVRAVILAGAGKHFCSGNDLGEFQTMTSANARERMFHVREAFSAIYTCEVPVIASVHGVALGTGLAIAASCDFIVAAEDARFGLPEMNVGVMGGARHLARLLPEGFVRMLFFTADPLVATEFQRLGGVVEAVPGSELEATTRRYADRIARHSPVALRVAKEGLGRVESMELRRGYEAEQALTVQMADHPHAKEAVQAVIERRTPSYDS